MTTERDVQTFIHTIEEGVWSRGLRFLLLPAFVIAVTTFFIWKFHGLSAAEGMEQAQIAREIGRGNGFSTKVIRPLGIWEFRKFKGGFPAGNIPDVYHAPLNPFINSFFLKHRIKTWEMSVNKTLYPADLLIAEISIAFFALALVPIYFAGRELFGPNLAMLGTGLVIACNSFWQFALSGLPQMLMLFLFSGCLYVMAKALDARIANKRTAPWLAAAGALFGLLGLAHGLTLWIFAGTLLYTALVFLPRGRQALLMLATFSLVYAPWLLRNWHACGNPLGLACFSFLTGITGSEDVLMRSMKLLTRGLHPTAVGAKLQAQIGFQLDHLYPLLGASPVAPLFFVALLHHFKRQQAASFRWCVFFMAAGAVLGMAAFGMAGEDLQPNDLYILFVPIFIFYGLAFVLSLWSRLNVVRSVLRVRVIIIIYVISALPLLNAVRGHPIFHWPPYAPPFISVLNKWTNEDEIIVSDVPSAVAWYADRKSLWLPMTVDDFMSLNQSRALGYPLVGIYLTPVSCDAPYESGILDGEYSNWASIILAIGLGTPPNLPANFPLHAATRLPLNKECIYYSDRDRWSESGN